MKYNTRGQQKALPNPTPSAEIVQLLLKLGMNPSHKDDVVSATFDLHQGTATVAVIDHSTLHMFGGIMVADLMFIELLL